MSIWESTFDIHGFDKHQHVNASVHTVPEIPTGRMVRFAAHELQFNMADGDLEDEKWFWEEWDLVLIQESTMSEMYSVEAIRNSKDGQVWINAVDSWISGDYRVTLEAGPFDCLVELDETHQRISVHWMKKDIPQRSAENIDLESQKAGWDMSFLKSGEHPEDNPFQG